MLRPAKRIPTRSRGHHNVQIKTGYAAVTVSGALRGAAGVFLSQRDNVLDQWPCAVIKRRD
jgi:hypothetical protein